MLSARTTNTHTDNDAEKLDGCKMHYGENQPTYTDRDTR